MIIAMVDGKASTYGSWREFHKATFSPDCDYIVVETKIHGHTYKERKASLECIGIELSYILSYPGLYLSELLDIEYWLECQAKRYGLVEDFRENGLI